MEKHNFKVGDKVRIRSTSEFYREGELYNPIDKVGTITKLKPEYTTFQIRVEWEGSIFNHYNDEDLILESEYQEQMNTLQELADLGQEIDKMMETQGVKFDTEKAPMDLLPYESLEEIAKVLGFGAKKYARANWANGIKMSRLISASLRHIGQFNKGEDLDPESNTIHLANAACNLLFAIWMFKNRPDMDDRWEKDVKRGKKDEQ